MFTIFSNYSDALLEGFKFTLYSSILALLFSLIIGTLMAIFQLSHTKLIRNLAKAYVEFFRNIPLLVIVMFFYVVVPLYWFQIDGFTAGTIGLTIYTSAFIAETVRAESMEFHEDKWKRDFLLASHMSKQCGILFCRKLLKLLFHH